MVFNSLHFAAFFVVVTALYFALAHRRRLAMLLIASCYFYMAFRPVYILILAFTIAVDYVSGLRIEATTGETRRRWLIASIIANTAVLAVFKYWNFLDDQLAALLGLGGFANPVPHLGLLLPIGLSFHTFQSLSYTIEVYRGRQPAERNPWRFALYVMFYPQLVAGPIERPQNLLHQFVDEHRFVYDRVVSGLQLMAWGLVKKVVVADRLAAFVNVVYANPHGFPGVSYVVATVFFAFQIYCDFSGYSDIALGTARVMGFNLLRNFKRPYLSDSIADFWKRWHVSLSFWFRDYLYITLGGNREGAWRTRRNLMITFLVSGLWHGANWTYVIWGGLNGLYLVIEQVIGYKAPSRGVARLAGVLGTFALTCLAWVFFRAKTTADAVLVLRHFTDGFGALPATLRDPAFVKKFVLLGQSSQDFLLAIAGIVVLLGIEVWQQEEDVFDKVRRWAWFARWPAYLATVALFLYYGAFNTAQSFIYFQF
ncbi:MAG: MBOAT family protein [Gemmatimonadetes bacterium]|nr:MBOAT family protein [Gemmatimonadota bacterium]